MKIIKIAFCLIIVFSFILSEDYGQRNSNSTKNQDRKTKRIIIEFANKSLKNYIDQLVISKQYHKFGFKDMNDVRTAELGQPLKVKLIGLRDLKFYNIQMKSSQLLKETKTLWFPVYANGQIKTKLEIILKNELLIPGEFGGTRTVIAVGEAKIRFQHFIKSRVLKVKKGPFLIKIPALYAYFIYFKTTKKEFMIPAMVNSFKYKLQSNKIYQAKEMFLLLKKIAKNISETKIH